MAAADAVVSEIEVFASQIGSGPDSELGRMMTELRRSLGTSS
jgi:hypothetical protein